VAEDETCDRSVGTGLMWITSWNKTGYLVELAVDDEMKRKEIGSKIMPALKVRANHNNLRSIIVETQIGRMESIDFYLNQGFRIRGYNDRYYTNNPKSSADIAVFFSLDIPE